MTVHFLRSEQFSRKNFIEQKQKIREKQVLVVEHGKKCELGRVKYYLNYVSKYYGFVPVN